MNEMENVVIVFDARRDGYSIDQVRDNAITVGELIAQLEDLPEDMPVILSHDRGYTYGSLSRCGWFMRETQGKYGSEWQDFEM